LHGIIGRNIIKFLNILPKFDILRILKRISAFRFLKIEEATCIDPLLYSIFESQISKNAFGYRIVFLLDCKFKGTGLGFFGGIDGALFGGLRESSDLGLRLQRCPTLNKSLNGLLMALRSSDQKRIRAVVSQDVQVCSKL
jgi:hypothetical protein